MKGTVYRKRGDNGLVAVSLNGQREEAGRGLYRGEVVGATVPWYEEGETVEIPAGEVAGDEWQEIDCRILETPQGEVTAEVVGQQEDAHGASATIRTLAADDPSPPYRPGDEYDVPFSALRNGVRY